MFRPGSWQRHLGRDADFHKVGISTKLSSKDLLARLDAVGVVVRTKLSDAVEPVRYPTLLITLTNGLRQGDLAGAWEDRGIVEESDVGALYVPLMDVGLQGEWACEHFFDYDYAQLLGEPEPGVSGTVESENEE